MALTETALDLARTQCGVLTRTQLLASGVSRETLRWRVGRDWRLLLPGIYVLQTGLPSEEQRLVAAQLFGGDGAWLAGSTAAALHGLRACQARLPIRVLVPAPRRSRRVAWVDIRSTTLLGEPLVPRGSLRLGCLARAVVDAAVETPDERSARALVIEAVQRRLVRLDDLEHWVDARGRQHSRRLRRVLAEVAAGAWSAPEADLLALLRTSDRLPEPMANPVLTGPGGRLLTSPDVWLDDVGMAVLVQSRAFHADGLDWDDTVEQASDLSAARVVVVGVTPSALARDPKAQLARIELAHAEAARTGTRAPVTATARPTLPLERAG
ncbi:hypothetical protein GCM10009721_17700 [Terrabacter tumescens]|uniref:Transcriptional regulator, AbiEi antitoxin, Type IV TA system n=1 Tax=Terrabacter tumescens TaxID=60443 RepID=A0ABQ2HXA7_9MICO|nr:hypothetical protein [Terrabacter tumescens]GGM92485.1 hypothetical protein GCM10009721_17700 [Terrabacter tumescens]